MNWKVLATVVVLLCVAAGGWFYTQRAVDYDAGETQAAEEDIAPAPEKVVKEILAVESEPDYQQAADAVVTAPEKADNSDEIVRAAAKDLSENLASWLSPQHLLRKWVSMVDQMAVFKLPNKNLPVAYPKEKFLVVETANGLENDPANYDRWNLLVDTVTGLDPKRVAVYYKKWSPLLEDTYGELGNPNSFDTQLRVTIEHILGVETLPADVKLRRPKVYYEYVDQVLENADPLSKWLWRLGPQNMEKLQSWLRDLNSYL